ncbi:phospholipase [Afipia sp. P52-10]|uniref:VTT domain-containing protein n=1 Tax=Afipia sp. P52-10 TaxID=1429916 RepID=UPI0003DF03AE|nr:VTT domain-containing protein [Afipia sp. P52-10]ETR78570.1 phospholipase [Afipia sp. P52-10]
MEQFRPSSILVPGDTVWRVCGAERCAVLNDAADYFAALRAALLLAERQVYIIGWDIHSETALVGPSGKPDDDLPVALAPFLSALLAAKTELKINILIWDFATLYAAEREWDSAARFSAGGFGRLTFCLDSSLPLGSAQHQKFVVIDDAVAFAGGLDLTIRRWDTTEHRLAHPFRHDPAGVPYPPFHDVQCMVDGAAARAFGELAVRRWRAAGCTVDAAAAVAGDRWPASVKPQFENVSVGIARTELGDAGRPAVQEVDRLFHASIRAARRLIYIENQFTSATEIAHLLAQRMREVADLRVLIITPKMHASWFESQAMQSGRDGFLRPFVEAGIAERIRILYPLIRDGSLSTPVMIHSKVMIVDDKLLRIGSANLNNRSMGADTECDVAIEARSDRECRTVVALRHELLAHHCGLTAHEMAGKDADLFGFLDKLAASGAARTLQPIESDATAFATLAALVQPIADPPRPLNLLHAARRLWSPRTILVIVGLVVSLAGLALAWRYTPLRSYANVPFIAGLLGAYAHSALAPLFAVLAFVAGGLIVFPVVVLIAATAAAFGPWIGLPTATAGVMASALVVFLIGRGLGRERLQTLLGARALRVQRRIVDKGVLAVAVIRMVPIAPFSIVNLLAGASQLRLFDFLLGTLLGMAPGLVVMAALGAQIADFARNASWGNALMLGLTIVLWVAVCLAVQFVVTWFIGRRR